MPEPIPPQPAPIPAPVPAPENWIRITNVAPGDCIPREFDVAVSYSNVNVNPGAVGVACAGAAAPDQQVQLGAGARTLHLVHGGAGAGHTITATLKNAAGGSVASDTVSPVGIGNPCPIIIDNGGAPVGGLLTLDPTKAVSGTFEAKVGNGIHVHVYQPGREVNGVYQKPVLVFAGAAEVTLEKGAKQGKWKHAAIAAAKKGYQLRVILTKDGEVKAAVRAVFK